MAKYRIDVYLSDDPRQNYSLLHDEQHQHPDHIHGEFYKIEQTDGGSKFTEVTRAEWDEVAGLVDREIPPIYPNSDFGSGIVVDLRSHV